MQGTAVVDTGAGTARCLGRPRHAPGIDDADGRHFVLDGDGNGVFTVCILMAERELITR